MHRPQRAPASTFQPGRGRWAAALALIGLAHSLAAQAAVGQDSITLVPGAQYQLHGAMSRPSLFLFGTNNRKLWLLPLTLPVVDPAAEGGLVPTGVTVTGPDSGVLLLRDSAGAAWQFRPLVRAEPREIPPMVPKGVIRDLTLDLVSGKNPAGPLVAIPLAEAAGVPVQSGRLVVLVNSDWLGAVQAAYGGSPGYLLGKLAPADSEPPEEIASGTVVDIRGLMRRLVRPVPDRIDGRAVLRQRLFADFIGNVNPRWLSWRWEAVADSAGVFWRPLGDFPEMALADYNGAASRALRPTLPDLVNFGPRYPSQLTGTPAQVTVSRWLIGNLPWVTWDSVARELQASLTDSVIANAVARLPPSYPAEFRQGLIAALQTRRNTLPTAAHHFYGQLRAHAEVLGPAQGGMVNVDRTSPDTMAVRLGLAETRFFAGKETREVRIFLRSGSDTVRISGLESKHPGLWIVASGNGGEDLLEVASGSGGGLHLSDPGSTFRVEPDGAAKRDRGSHPDPLGSEIWSERLPRETGVTYRMTPWLEGSSGVGLVLGGGVIRTDWNGEARPWHSRMRLRAAYGTGAQDGAVEFTSEFRFASTPVRSTLKLAITGLALVRFYGYGNETPAPQPSSYYRSNQNQYLVIPGVTLPAWKHALLNVGLAFKKVETPLQPDHYVSVVQPYGTPYFGQTGLTAGASWDTRDVKGAPHRGLFVTVDGAWYPIIEDGSGDFGDIEGAVSTYLTPRSWDALTIATRIAGKTTLGHYPLHEAAFLGGGTTVRGLPDARYAGDQSLFGNLDLRVRLFRTQAVARWDFGVLFLADVGRVFLAGESSQVWHPSVGGGLWLALLDRSLVANVNIAGGAGQGTYIRFGGGFVF